MMYRYALADYQAVITVESEIDGFPSGTQIAIGGPGDISGPGSFLNSITVSRATDMWSTKGDATGSWVHEKSLDKHGTCVISLNQISDNIQRLINLCKAFESVAAQSNIKGLTITIYANSGENATTKTVCVCNDCYISKTTDQVFGSESADQEWTFTCGQVIFQ